ncbi:MULTISPECIES: hypothetical protein [unclassified Arcicella]|uniref:hypothetical protein n=1 Tax=unclassified Arcicella TaxID=2644986 RepID=UPI002855B690|nr:MULTISPECIES: hypothetical protein [unclassified Arcicella]MDR6560181.1 hypothetical protein [Arcicella sp. BE51]MDR6810212.1 hypothetical protein [Arcicella sp. BE140]MDR6821562.1 hypothetical protein [Arcicella sp. BE139]
MKLIFIHGRAQGRKDPIALRKQWIDTFKVGLAKSGLSIPILEENIYFPYYGDILDELVFSLNQPMENIIKKGSDLDNKDAKFFNDFLLELASNAKITEEDIEKNSSQEIVKKGPLNWNWIQAILRTLDNTGKLGELSIKQFTYDVYLYLTMPNIKNAINTVVKNQISNEPYVVVGHSLGTIISYNILRDSTELNVCKYITIGSPLGLKSVKKYLKTPIKMPDCVKNGWFNAFDDRDVVALNPLDKTYFNIQPQIENKSDVDNQTSNRHGIEGYLNDKTVSKVIYDALIKDCIK